MYPEAPDGTDTLSEDLIAVLKGFDVSCEIFTLPTAAYAANPGSVPWKPLFLSSCP
jgi:hypothetical protein